MRNKLIAGIISILFFSSCNNNDNKIRVLVFSKTNGYRHESIAAGKTALLKMGNENNWKVDTTEDATVFTDENLKKYAAIIFLSTTENILNYYQEISFERYIQAGGGFVGIHAATDTEYDWIWYSKLVGAQFESHPKIQAAKLYVVDKNHLSTKHIDSVWNKTDEWYNFKNINKDVHVLLKIDETSYEGGKLNNDHPMAWYHEYDGGRAFYTELGHTPESYTDFIFLNHLLGGIKYVIGEKVTLDYKKSKSQFAPDSNQISKTILSQGEFYEPTEMTVLPNLDVLVIQRRGEILIYKNDDKKIKKAGFLNVYYRSKKDTTVNAEEGLLGICKDPDFVKNNQVYIFYSPADTSVNRLSRFELKNDTIDMKSEKIVLQFYSQREICCHTGGSIAFGPDRTLFLSTGDNSTPFDEKNQSFVNRGFAPLDDRPGHEQYDARRTSSNSNDLRGKIIRIKINQDASYSIPVGNLFSKDQPATKPEIYVMGNRNPYRISVDQKNSFLYWGEVGPDSDFDSLETRGPRGYDEVNQARNAGYFGWPLFVGKNFPYYDYNYNTGQTGIKFDATKPMNNSRNNTGLKELPPVSPAFIWYPYKVSHDFPQLATGGRTAMAGPVYHSELYEAKTRMPEYYNGKLFIYEWMRNWIKVVSLQPNGDFYRMEPFMQNIKFAAPVDMELGPDGKLYILEYGTGWFSKNKDAGLSRIDFKK